MRVEVSVPGVRPERAWAWWTDFQDGAGDHAFAAWAHPDRRVERLDDGTLRLTETARIWRWRYLEVSTLTLARPRVRFDMRNNVGHFWGHVRFLPHAEGTRLEVVWDEELRGPLRWFGPLGSWVLRRFFAWDLRHHVREMQRDASAPGPHT